MRNILWIIALMLLAILVVCVAIFSVPDAPAHATWPAYTTDTLTTSDTLQPQWMIPWIVVLDEFETAKENLQKKTTAQVRIMCDPAAGDDAKFLATLLVVQAQGNMKALDNLFKKISQHDVLEINSDARDYGVWVDNPLKEPEE